MAKKRGLILLLILSLGIALGISNSIEISVEAKNSSSHKVIYVSPEGSDEASGSKGHPYETIQTAIDKAKPGTTIYLRQGTYLGYYSFTHSGKKGKPITITSYKNESVLLTNESGQSGAVFSLDGHDYISIKNINIGRLYGQDVYGILMTGGEHHVAIRGCDIYNIKTSDTDSGESNAILLLGQGKSQKTAISDITISSNQVHDNVNGWSENISICGNCKKVNVINNKVYNNTNIGIDFCGNADYMNGDPIFMPRDCKAIGNTVYNCNSSYAENAGIYVDGARNITIKKNKVHNNAYGIEIGSEVWKDSYTKKNRVRSIVVSSNKIYDNYINGIRIGGFTAYSSESAAVAHDSQATGTVYNCLIKNNSLKRNGLEGEIYFSKCRNITVKNNKFTLKSGKARKYGYDDAIPSGLRSGIKIK